MIHIQEIVKEYISRRQPFLNKSLYMNEYGSLQSFIPLTPSNTERSSSVEWIANVPLSAAEFPIALFFSYGCLTNFQITK